MISTYLNHNHRICPYPNWFLSFPDICSRWSKQTKNDSTIPCGFPISIMQMSEKKTCNKKEKNHPRNRKKSTNLRLFLGFSEKNIRYAMLLGSSRSKVPKFPQLRPGCFGRAMAPTGASSAPRCAPRPGTAARAGCRRRGHNCRRRGRRRNEAPSWTLDPGEVPLSFTYLNAFKMDMNGPWFLDLSWFIMIKSWFIMIYPLRMDKRDDFLFFHDFYILNYRRICHTWVNCLYWTNQKNFLRGILLLAEVSEGINPKNLRILRMIPPILSIIYGESRGSEGHSLFCFGNS